FQVDVDLTPGDDDDGIGAGGVQLAHGGDKQLVGLLLHGVDVDDMLPQLFGVMEVRKLVHQHADFLAAADQHGAQLNGVGAHDLVVVAVHPHPHVLDLVYHSV